MKRLHLKNLELVVKAIAFFLISISSVYPQPGRRTAVLPVGSSYIEPEQRLVTSLIGKLVEDSGVQVIDREKTQAILAEQNNQWNGRFSPESAVQIGRLLGVPMIVFTRIDSYSSTMRTTNKGSKHVTSGSVLLKASAQIINVESGAIISAPMAEFDREQVLSEATDRRGPVVIGPVQIPRDGNSTGADPQVGLKRLNEEAIAAVVQQLEPKIANALLRAPAQTIGQRIAPKVAGIQNGMTFINAGATAGLRKGNVFRIVRIVDSGMQDPDTYQPIMRNKQVCLLTVSEVDDSLSSGKCEGDIPQVGDQVLPAETSSTGVSPPPARDAEGDSGCSMEPRLKSLGANEPLNMSVTNERPEAMQLFWIGYDGKRVLYKVLSPHETYVQTTFVGHPWILATENGICRKLFVVNRDSTRIIAR
jgi:hypothetical protein